MSNSNSLKIEAAITILASVVTLVVSNSAANATDTQRLLTQNSHVQAAVAADSLEGKRSRSIPARGDSRGKFSKTRDAVIGNLKG